MIAIATEGSDLGLYAKTLRNDKQNLCACANKKVAKPMPCDSNIDNCQNKIIS